MLLGLGKIIDTPGESISFSDSVDMSDLGYGICRPVSEPVLIDGTVRNTAGVLLMKGLLRTTIHGICDRCADEFSRDVQMPVDVVLTSELSREEDEDESVFPIVGDSADLEEIVRTVFVLNFESQLLCRQDCQGLCPSCGRNLNESPCQCRKQPDPRFAVLQQLLDK